MPLSYQAPRSSSKVHLYWEKFPATKGPSRGAVIFLAGGPLPHWIYHGRTSPHFLKGILDEYDLYLFDYRGLNCSSRVQTMATLRRQLREAPQAYSIGTFAADVRSLRDQLVGRGKKVILLGGSYGFFVGVQVLIDHPDIVESAILYHGDTDGAFWHQGMLRLDRLITTTLAKRNPRFVARLEALRRKLDAGQVLLFPGTPKQHRLSWAELQVSLWMHFGQSVAAQEKLPRIVELLVKGGVPATKILEGLHQTATQLARTHLDDAPKAPPTAQSLITGYARCNVLFDRGVRAHLTAHPVRGKLLGTEALVSYFNGACKSLDTLPTQRFDVTARLRPVASPVLIVHTGRDMFVPERVTAHLKKLGPATTLRFEPEWSHDFGADHVAGAKRFTKMVRAFLGLGAKPAR